MTNRFSVAHAQLTSASPLVLEILPERIPAAFGRALTSTDLEVPQIVEALFVEFFWNGAFAYVRVTALTVRVVTSRSRVADVAPKFD
jgi:hypothetical protein